MLPKQTNHIVWKVMHVSVHMHRWNDHWHLVWYIQYVSQSLWIQLLLNTTCVSIIPGILVCCNIKKNNTLDIWLLHSCHDGSSKQRLFCWSSLRNIIILCDKSFTFINTWIQEYIMKQSNDWYLYKKMKESHKVLGDWRNNKLRKILFTNESHKFWKYMYYWHLRNVRLG